MTIGADWRMGRRDFLTFGAVLALGAVARPAAAEDHQARHNMLVFGERVVFLSHLPMFEGLNAAGTEFDTPHRYQVILEAALTGTQLDAYVKDRQANPGTRFYTLGPESFVLSRLFTPVAPERLRQGQRIEAMLRVGSAAPAKVQLELGPQVYFEEGELLVPPTFDLTDEEKK